MAEITAAMVKELRETSGAGMMDAKKALVENNGDMQAAQDWLRKKGLSTAAKKSSRTAAEGLVGLAVSGTTGAVVEINAETDFVARNDQFQGFVKKASEVALAKANDVEALAAADFGNGKSVKDTLTDLIATIGENMSLRRMTKLSVKDGVVAGYVHNAIVPGMGKIGVLVALESAGKKDVLEQYGKQIAMHVAAAFPQFLNRESVDTTAIERERTVLRDQEKQQGNTDEVIDKMIEGRMRKFYEEIVLLDQIFVVDGETRISALLEKAGKEAGAPVTISGYARLQLGEGIEKEAADFAAEVAAAANG
jgi:elongation factor Ts